MTTATRPARVAGAPGQPAEELTGTLSLVRLALRRDRLRLPVWWLAIGGLTYVSGAAVSRVYDDVEAVAGYGRLVEGSAVTVAFSGPPVGLDTRAGIVVYETVFTAVLGVSLMALLMVARHTRAEEESGRSELVRAVVVGRHAGAAAAFLFTSASSVVLGALLATSLLPTDLSAAQASLFGASVAALGVFFAAVALCFAQLFVHARSATGAGLLVFVVAYAVRAAGDVAGNGLVWLSPVGWAQATRVPTEERWWPVLLLLGASAALVTVARGLAERRDFGGGFVPERVGPPRAGPLLSGPFGLGVRVRRTAVLGWALGAASLAILTGALSTSVQDMVEDNPTLAEYLETTSGASVVDSYLAQMGMILALVVGGFAVWSAQHPGADEESGQLELVLAGSVGRARALLVDGLVTALSATAVLGSAAVGLAVTHGTVMGSLHEAWHGFGAPLVYLPAVLLLVALQLAVRGWLPRWSWVGWALLAFWAVLGWLGSLLDPPQWVFDLSAFERTPHYPAETAGAGVVWLLAAMAFVLASLAAVGFRSRDVG